MIFAGSLLHRNKLHQLKTHTVQLRRGHADLGDLCLLTISLSQLFVAETRDIGKPVPSNLHNVTHSVLAQMAAQLKQVAQMSEDVEGLKAGQAQTTHRLTYLARVGTLCVCSYSKAHTAIWPFTQMEALV